MPTQATPPRSPQPDAARAIRALETEFSRAMSAGDVERVVAGYYADDAWLLPPNRTMVRGRAQIREFIKGFLAAGAVQLEISPADVTFAGDMAYSVGRYELRGAMTDEGKYLDVYRRQPDGSWRCVADMFSSDHAV